VTRRTPPFVQKLVWRLEALGFDLITLLLRPFPVDWVSAWGAGLFKALGPLTPSHRIAAMNIDLAFPELAPDARAALLSAQWESLGRTFFEFPLMDRLTPASGRVEVVGAERLAEIAKGGRPVVFVSGHLSNWEIMAATIVRAGVNCQITYRAANNPYVDASFKRSRARYGVKLFAPKGGEGARELLDSMAVGESVALMNDQKFNGGVRAPFFGHPADTAPGPSRLALRFGTVLQPMSVERTKGARFKVVVHPEIRLERTGNRARDLEAGVRAVNAFVEARVRERPHEWFWVHRRWPREVYPT
jgi:KDO2-lipid IV(A) lauroyltransferase